LKLPVTKADLRRELDRQIDAYLREGGQVQEIPRGISGREPSDGPLPAAPFFGLANTDGGGETKEKRAYLTDVIAAIEARRKPQAAAKTKPRRPRKKFIYDDFGEPVRWVWEE
jgi:hypothetical protein